MSEQKKKIPEKKVEKQFGESAEHTFTNPPRQKKPENTNDSFISKENKPENSQNTNNSSNSGKK